jgi:MFS family permease
MAAGWGISMTVASMFAGGLIDRKPVQKVMAGALATQAAAVGGIIALLALGFANPWMILPLYSLAGVTQGVVLTARGTLPTRILASDESVLGKFNAKTHMIYETAGTIAPLLVGLLISKAGLLAGLFMLPPAFLLAALAFSRLKLGPAKDEERVEGGFGLKDRIKRTALEVREGARIMLGSKEFRWLGVMMAGPTILHRVVEQILTPFFANSVLHASAQAALIVSGSNLGELVGAAMLLSTLRNREKGQKPTPLRWIRPMALAGLCAWAFLTGALWLVIPAVLAMGLAFAANDVGISSYFQSLLPSGSSGKAMGFLMAAELGSVMAVSYTLGFLLDMLPVGAALVVVGAAFSAMIPLFYKGYGRLRVAQKSRA